MAKSKGSSDRDKWNKVFNAMVRMLRRQQTQLESLAKDRKLLEDRIKLQYDRWVSDVNLFQDQITQVMVLISASASEVSFICIFFFFCGNLQILVKNFQFRVSFETKLGVLFLF